MLVVKENGQWRAPVFIRLAGGNVGWQVGVQATDVILVFKTKRSVQGISPARSRSASTPPRRPARSVDKLPQQPTPH